jgi:hypothetical protein
MPGAAITCAIVGTLVSCTGLPPSSQRPDPAQAAAVLASHPSPGAHAVALTNAWGEEVRPGMEPAVAYGAPAEVPQGLPYEPSPNAIPWWMQGNPWLTPYAYGWPGAYATPYATLASGPPLAHRNAELTAFDTFVPPPAPPCPPQRAQPSRGGYRFDARQVRR